MGGCDNFAYENRFQLSFGNQEFWGLERKVVDLTLPAITIGTTLQPTHVRPIWIPGDSLDIGEMTMTVLLDDDWANYKKIAAWVNTLRNFDRVELERLVTDMSVTLLDTKFKPTMVVTCKDSFPYSVGEVFMNQQVESAEALRFLVTFKINGVEYE